MLAGHGHGHGLDLALLMLRVAAGGFLLPHALGKLFGWFGGPGLAGFATELRGFGLPAVAPLPLLLSLLQVLSGLAVLLGWQTRIAALAAAVISPVADPVHVLGVTFPSKIIIESRNWV